MNKKKTHHLLKMKILSLSKNMDYYQGAMYQKNVMGELNRHADVGY